MIALLRRRQARRTRARRAPAARLGRAAVVLLALATLAFGALGTAVAWAYLQVQQGLPPVEEVAAFFQGERGAFEPLTLYDRTGRVVLYQHLNPRAEARYVLSLDPLAPHPVPQAVVQATVAALDPAFWEHGGVQPARLAANLAAAGLRLPPPEPPTLAEQLVAATLLSGERAEGAGYLLRRAMLAQELVRRYPREQLLAWYLNSAHYGRQAFGIDAAALVYFGRHVDELDLAEIALLAALPLNPEANPVDDPQAARRLQAEVLEALVRQGLLEAEEADRLERQPLRVVRGPADPRARLPEAVRLALAQLEALLGPQALARGGLRVRTSLDADLQAQSACALRTHLLRLGGGDPSAALPAEDGRPCEAASLLPPLRPRDIGLDHRVDSAAALVLDPQQGEVLALVGEPEGVEALATAPRPAGTSVYPFLYLAGFARGYAPATMVVDVPEDPDEGPGHGPVRMRIALANGYRDAARQALSLIGVDNVSRTARGLGLVTWVDSVSGDQTLFPAHGRTTLVELTRAYAVLAARGQMVGLALEEGAPLTPTLILEVQDAAGRNLFTFEPARRAVVSEPLAYLMVDVLSDEAARWPTFGQGNVLEIGRPAGAYVGTTEAGAGQWTVGFTPDRVVGVWLGNRRGEALREVTLQNGAAALWHALQRFATQGRPPQGWQRPPGVSELEVCDPSGLLPTVYCPQVVREVFLDGTEPVAFDNLYQPFRINRETGKLATFFTPLDLVEERVYFVPPPEAVEWARRAGIEGPPQEYDTLYAELPAQPGVALRWPKPFATLRGEVTVQGTAGGEAFRYYRLQYGEGLNPTRWVQIGEDQASPVEDGVLGRWDTAGLNGLFVLQLVVVREDGRVGTAAVPVTVDNQAPEVRIIAPRPGEVIRLGETDGVPLEVEVQDAYGVARVQAVVDGRVAVTWTAPPYSGRWEPEAPGEVELVIRAEDLAGNVTETEPVPLEVRP